MIHEAAALQLMAQDRTQKSCKAWKQQPSRTARSYGGLSDTIPYLGLGRQLPRTLLAARRSLLPFHAFLSSPFGCVRPIPAVWNFLAKALRELHDQRYAGRFQQQLEN